jgi:hypothetical protein
MSKEERIEALTKAPPNGWVAFSADETRVVAYGTTYDEVIESARRFGEAEPVVVKVPETWARMVMSN